MGVEGDGGGGFEATSPLAKSLGQNIWQYNDPACAVSSFTIPSLAISTLGSQFSSGSALASTAGATGWPSVRTIKENCQTIHFRETYDKDQVLELEKRERRPNPIHTHVSP